MHVFGNGWPENAPKNMYIHKPVYGKEFRKFAMSEKGVSGLNLDYFEKHIEKILYLAFGNRHFLR